MKTEAQNRLQVVFCHGLVASRPPLASNAEPVPIPDQVRDRLFLKIL